MDNHYPLHAKNNRFGLSSGKWNIEPSNLNGNLNYVLKQKLIIDRYNQVRFGKERKETLIMHERIELNPMVCHGKPVIRGTRVMVSTVLGALAAGDSMEMILKDYPNIEREDIAAALAFASELSQFEDIPYQLNLA